MCLLLFYLLKIVAKFKVSLQLLLLRSLLHNCIVYAEYLICPPPMLPVSGLPQNPKEQQRPHTAP